MKKQKQIPEGYKEVEVCTLYPGQYCLIDLEKYSELIIFELEKVQANGLRVLNAKPPEHLTNVRKRMVAGSYKVLIREEGDKQLNLF